MSSTEAAADSLDDAQRQTLLDLARASIRHGLAHDGPLPVEPGEFAPPLRQQRAVFVTLQRQGQLRGCIGHLEASQALVKDVADNAYAAAFRDPRFPPLAAAEFDDLEVHISILSPPETLPVVSEADLLNQIRPGIDGLILEEGTHRGTFLPSVWDSLPQPAQFLAHLKLKAGLSPAHWSDGIRMARYTTESFGD